MKGRAICFWVVLVMGLTGSAMGGGPVAVSPGGEGSIALINQECPTFSWSQVEGAISYRLKVFERVNGEILSYEDMDRTGEPVMSVEIKAPALSWTPWAGECFGTGRKYVWYVGAISGATHPEPVEGWSEGRGFEVSGNISSGLSEAVKETVKEYLTKEWVSTESYQEVKEAIASQVSQEVKGLGGGGVVASQNVVPLGTEGANNTFYGTGAGAAPPSGIYNTFIGVNAGHSNTTAGNNTFVGDSAGYTTTEGQENTFIGSSAGYNNGTGNYNAFLGNRAGYSNSGGYENTFIGHSAGYSNIGSHNTFLGKDAGRSNTSADRNTFVGYRGGYSNITGTRNTFLGYSAGYNNNGVFNTFVGDEAGYTNSTGVSNTFLGSSAGSLNSTGGSNTFLGVLSGYFHQMGSFNTFVGNEAGYANETGEYNTLLGWGAGHDNMEGAGNVFIGYRAGYNEKGTDRLYIANSNTATPLIYGEFDNQRLVVNGNLEVIGPDQGLVRLSNVTTDSTTKASRMVLRHYSNAQLPVYLFGAASTSTNSFVAFGGGNPIGNAATQLDLFTAPNTTTPTGFPRLTIIGNGYVGIGTQAPDYPLEMASGAHVTAGGVWTDASSREYKQEIESLTQDEAMHTLMGLQPVKFAYKADPSERHVGFIAEDVPALVATKDRKGMSPMDVVAVLTKVVQNQQKTIAELSEKLKEFERNLKRGGTSNPN